MGATTEISWSDATWNPLVGCTKVSPGCDHCYAENLVNRFAGSNSGFPNRFDVLTLRSDKHLTQPLRWREPKMVFVNSLSDLFHSDVPDEFIARVFAVMALTQQHTFQLLTKRHARMRALLSSGTFWASVGPHMSAIVGARTQIDDARSLPNVWLGVSVENQEWANIRIPALLETPAAVRFLSCEPLLGPVTLDMQWLGEWHDGRHYGTGGPDCPRTQHHHHDAKCPRIGWVIAGGESGPGARPMHPDWARSLRDKCIAARVPFHFKQWGEWQDGTAAPGQRGVDHIMVIDGRHEPAAGHQDYGIPLTALAKARACREAGTGSAVFISRVGKRASGRELDGRTWDEFPAVSR